VRLQRLMTSMRLQSHLKSQKSLLKTSESSRLLNSAYFDAILMFWKKSFLVESWLNFSNFSVGDC
jgi:hypothetical protein